MAELSLGKGFETRGKAWLSLQAGREAVDLGSLMVNHHSGNEYPVVGVVGTRGEGGGGDRVGHCRSTLHWT